MACKYSAEARIRRYYYFFRMCLKISCVKMEKLEKMETDNISLSLSFFFPPRNWNPGNFALGYQKFSRYPL